MRHPCAWASAALLAVAGHAAPAFAQEIDPDFAIEPSHHDFGEVRAGTAVQTTFTFTNTGADTLKR